MTIIYRNTNTPLWGPGKGSNLTPDEVDMNFWTLFSLYVSINDHLATAAVGVATIEVHFDQMLFVMTDATTRGPFQIPTSQWTFTGPWQPNHAYNTNDVLTDTNGGLYLVPTPVVSGPTFNAGLFDLILQPPGTAIPTGGLIGQSLKKASLVDFALMFAWDTYAELNDVALGSPLDTLDMVYWNGTHWTNQHFIKEQQLLQTTAQSVASAAGVLTVDRSKGEIVDVSLTENITSVVVTNWPASGYLGKILFQMTNTASYTVAGWPSGTKKVGASFPVITPSGVDRFVLATSDDGSSLFLDTIGQNYT